MSKKVLLIDDDGAFARGLRKEGRRQGAEVDWYSSLTEVGRVGRLGEYDCVIAALSSEPVTGIEIARYAAAFFSDLPVLLVSDDAPVDKVSPIRSVPRSGQARIPKQAGAAAVMHSALRMCAEVNAEILCPPMPRARADRYRLSA